MQEEREIHSLGGWKKAEEKNRKKIARIRVYRKDSDHDPELMVDWSLHKPHFNGKDSIYKITLRNQDGDTRQVEMRYEDFIMLHQEYINVDILEEHHEVLEKNLGKTRRVTYEGPNATQQVEHELVDQVVTKTVTICTIDAGDWGKFEIPLNRLNQ